VRAAAVRDRVRGRLRRSAAFRRPPVVERSGHGVIAMSSFGQAYALLLLGLSWTGYDRPWVQLGLWLLLTAAAPAMVAVAERHGGGLPGRAAVPVVALLVVLDLAVPALTGGGRDPIGAAAWNWGAVAIALLWLAIYRPAGEVLSLAALHGLACLVWSLAVPVAPNDPVRVALSVALCLLPALAGAQFVGFYLGVLLRREEAARAERETRARQAAEEATRRDWRQRIDRVRREALPLIAEVADGRPLPLDEVTVARARRISDRLRRELVGGREIDWLLRAQVAGDGRADGEPGDEPGDEQVDVEVVTGLGAARLMTDETRVALGALVSLLRRHPGWTRMTLTVAGAPDRSLMLALVAKGPAAAVAHADDAVRAALRPLAATSALDEGETLVIQTRLEETNVATGPAGEAGEAR
jgi:hypothetical protein